MKTTDSVMREEVEEILVKIAVFESNGGDSGMSVSEGIDRVIDLYSHSLAEARREWIEEMRGLKNPDNDCRHSPEDSCDSNCTYQNEHKIYNQAIDDGIDLLTGDNPESECKVCHRTSDVVDMSKCPFCEHDQELIREGRAMSDRDTRRGE